MRDRSPTTSAALAGLVCVLFVTAPLGMGERGGTARAEVRVEDAGPAVQELVDFLNRPLSRTAADENGWRDLHYAALLNLPDAVAALIDAGMRPDVSLKGDSAPFSDALAARLAALGYGEVFQDWVRDGDTPLMIAATVNAVEAAQALIAHGAGIMTRDYFGGTPLHYAALGDARDAAELLIAHGADIDATDRFGATPLFSAMSEDAVQIAALLIDRPVDVHARDVFDRTLLHMAAMINAQDIAALLISYGADIDARTESDHTPLHYAAATHAVETVELLLALGADVNAKSDAANTPLDLAKFKDQYYPSRRAATLEALRRHGGKTSMELR